jgi:hypothetical protein
MLMPGAGYRPSRIEPYRVRPNRWKRRLPYPADAGAPATTILEAPVQGVISTSQVHDGGQKTTS